MTAYRFLLIGTVALLAWAPDALGQSCTYYLNATDGDDANSGTSPAQAVRSFEHAFHEFPSDAVVCMTAGEYFHSLDADGVQLTGSDLSGKNMRFVLQSFGGAAEVAFTEDEFRTDIGSGRIVFTAGSTQRLRFGVGTINSPKDYATNTTFLHTLAIASGTLDVSGVEVTIGPSVGNRTYGREGHSEYAAPDSATIAIGTGTVVGAPLYQDAIRSLTYIGAGDREAGNLVPPQIDRLVFNHQDGTVAIAQSLPFAEGSAIELKGAGDARFSTAVSLSDVSFSAVTVTGSGTLDFTAGLSLSIVGSADRLLHLASAGNLRISNLAISASAGTGVLNSSMISTGSGVIRIQSVDAGSGITVQLRNENSGSFELGTASSRTTIEAGLYNAEEGSTTIKGETSIRGDITNVGHLIVAGPAEFTATVENRGSIDLQADITVSGNLVNSGEVELASNDITIVSEGPHENSGRITGLEGAGHLQLAAATAVTGTGTLPSIVSTAGEHLVIAAEVAGDVTVRDGAELSLTAERVSGEVAITGGDLTLEAGRIGSISAESGSVTVAKDVAVAGPFLQATEASVHLGSSMLILESSFERIGGDFSTDGGGLRFRGKPIQMFQPGPDLAVDKLVVVATEIRLESGPVHVADSLVVDAGAKLLLSDNHLKLAGAETAVLNDGGISTSTSGALAFAGPTGSSQTLSGSGFFGNIEIDLDDEDESVLVKDADVKQGGTLTLTSGVLRIAPGNVYSLVSTRGIPLIRRNLGDENGDGEPAGKPIEANTSTSGSFLSPEQGYNLEYFGILDGPASTGSEFVSGRIIDLFVRVRASDGASSTLNLSERLSFTGSLELEESAVIDLGQHDLVSTGSGITHDIYGLIEGAGGAFVVRGSSVVLEGLESSPSSLTNLRIESEAGIQTHSIREIAGFLEVTSGDVELALITSERQVAGSIGRLIIQSPASIKLASDIWIAEAVEFIGGEIDLDKFDITMGRESSFAADVAAKFAPGREGAVVFTDGGEVRTGGAPLTNLRVEMTPDSRLTLSGDVVISESLVISSGEVDLTGHDLIFRSGTWHVLGGQIEGTGSVVVEGPVSAELATDISVPNLRLQTASVDTGLSLRSTSSAPSRLIINEQLSMGQGQLDLGNVDLVVGRTGSASVFEYESGTVTMVVAGDIDSAANGELVLTDTEVDLAAPLSIPNVQISGFTRFRDGSAPLRIVRQIAFHSGQLINADSTRVRLADDVRIVRRGTGTFAKAPITEGSVNLYYEIRGVHLDQSALTMGEEVPMRSSLRSITVDAGANTLRLSEDITVSDKLRLDSGRLDLNGFELTVPSGSTVHYDYSTDYEPTFKGGSFSATGPVRIVFSGTENASSNELTLPPSIDVSELVAAMGRAGGDAALLSLHTSRRIGNLTVSSENAASGLDLNGRTLLVDSDASVDQGVITSDIQGFLEIGDSLMIASEAGIKGVVAATVGGHSDIAGFFDGYLLRVHGDLMLSGEFGGDNEEPTADAAPIVLGIPNLEFVGGDHLFLINAADENHSSIDEAVNQLVVSATGVVRMVNSSTVPYSLAANRLVLKRGILETGTNDIRLPGNGQGFDREEGAISHVAGRVSRLLGETSSVGLFVFPVGSAGARPTYRPVSLNLSEGNTVITVRHSGSPPEGLLGFPLQTGENVEIGDMSGFHWTLSADPALPPFRTFTLGVVGSKLNAFSAGRDLRLIRRSGGEPWEHAWTLHGTPADYNNAIVSLDDETVPFVQAVEVGGGIPAEPEVFAIGIKASERNFARVQFANLLAARAPVLNIAVNDSARAVDLPYGEATHFVRADSGLSEVVLTDEHGAVVLRDSIHFAAGEDYVVAAVVDGPQGRPVLVARRARAIPALEAKDDVSLSFFNGIPDAPALSLRRRGDLEILFSGIPYAQISEQYAAIPPENTGFDVISSSRGFSILSVRSQLDDYAGGTVTAFAGGYLNPGAVGSSAGPEMFLITNHGRIVSTGVQVAVDQPEDVPSSFALHGNYPNPFNPSTNVVFDLPEASDVSIELYDILGRSVMHIGPSSLAAGRQTVRIDASELASGVYVYRVIAKGVETHVASGKMTLLR